MSFLDKSLPTYNKNTSRLWHEVYFDQFVSQWRFDQMIPYISWNGADITDTANETGLLLGLGMGTTFGVCNWITPLFRMPSTFEDAFDFHKMTKGAYSGLNNGLTLLLDAETFDYGGGHEPTMEHDGEWIKVSIVHPLDTPIMEQTGLDVAPGNNRFRIQFSSMLQVQKP